MRLRKEMYRYSLQQSAQAKSLSALPYFRTFYDRNSDKLTMKRVHFPSQLNQQLVWASNVKDRLNLYCINLKATFFTLDQLTLTMHDENVQMTGHCGPK